MLGNNPKTNNIETFAQAENALIVLSKLSYKFADVASKEFVLTAFL